MARERNDAYRRELARAALAALMRLGGVGVSMVALARELGISRSLLYFYFPTQRAIGEAVLEDLLAGNRALSEQIDLDVLSAHDALVAYLDAVFAMGARPVAEMETLLRLGALYAESPAQLLAVMQANLQPFRARLARKVKKAIAAGEMAACDAEVLVDSVRAFAEGWMIQNFAGHGDLKRARRLFVDTVLGSLAAVKSKERPAVVAAVVAPVMATGQAAGSTTTPLPPTLQTPGQKSKKQPVRLQK